MRIAGLVVLLLASIAWAADVHDHAHGEKHAHEEKHGHDEKHTDEVKLTPEAVERYGIKVAAVTSRTLPRIVSAPARVSFNTEAMAHVGAAVEGRATEIKVRVGDAVNKGDELLVIESPALGEAQSDFLQKHTAVAVASSAMEPARESATRARKLFDQNQGIALGEVQKREAELKAGQGAVQSAEAALTAAEHKLHLLGMDQRAVEGLLASKEINPRYVVRAPLAGQVVEREVTLGEWVTPEKDALMMLADVSTLWVIADLPESRLKEIAVGAAASVRIDAVGEEAIEGKIAFIAPSLDADTRTARVRIDVQNKDQKLKPGMFATASLASAQTSNGAAVLAVPDAAVQIVEGGPAVFVPVEGEENTFAKRAVSVGSAAGGFVPITEGLKEGEKVVVSGSFILKAELGKSEAAHEH